MGYGRDLSLQQDCYLAISMSASLTGAAPLYCSSMLLALLCISAKSNSSLAKYPLLTFELVKYVLLFPLPRYDDGSSLFR